MTTLSEAEHARTLGLISHLECHCGHGHGDQRLGEEPPEEPWGPVNHHDNCVAGMLRRMWIPGYAETEARFIQAQLVAEKERLDALWRAMSEPGYVPPKPIDHAAISEMLRVAYNQEPRPWDFPGFNFARKK